MSWWSCRDLPDGDPVAGGEARGDLDPLARDDVVVRGGVDRVGAGTAARRDVEGDHVAAVRDGPHEGPASRAGAADDVRRAVDVDREVRDLERHVRLQRRGHLVTNA